MESWKKRNHKRVKRQKERRKKRQAIRSPAPWSVCIQCGLEKPSDAFSMNRARASLLNNRCRLCIRIYALYGAYLYRDRTRGFDTCSLEELKGLITGAICYVCAASKNIGADRIDNTKGHTIENLLPCCGRCNGVRGNRWTVEVMREILGPAIIEADTK